MKHNLIRRALEAAVASGYMTAENAAEIERKSDAQKELKSELEGQTTSATSDKDTLSTLDRDLDHAKHRLGNPDLMDGREIVSIAIEVRDFLKRSWEKGCSSVCNRLFVYDRELANAFGFLEALDGACDSSKQVVALLFLNRCLLIDYQQLHVFRDALGTSEKELENARQEFQAALAKSQDCDISTSTVGYGLREV